MHRALTLLTILAGCGVKRNPEACDRDEQCSNGYVCNLDTNRCEMPPDGSTRCTTNDQCPVVTPICGVDQTCRSCKLDDECASGVCHPEGLCEAVERVLYVSPTGISAGTCSPTSPCDLAFARSQLSLERATIRLANGIYTLASDFTITGSATRATIVGGQSAVIQRSNLGAALHVTLGATLTLRGFSASRGVACSDAKLSIERLAFDSASETRPWISAAGCTFSITDSELNNSSAEGIITGDGNGATPATTIRGTKIRNSVGNGIRVTGGACSITTSLVTGGMQMGVAADSVKLSIERSIVSHNRAGGISLMGSGSSYDITNNFVFRNGNDANGAFGGLRLAPTSSGNNKVRHNTITFNDSQVDANPLYAGGLYCTNGTAANNLIFANYAGNTTQPNAQFAGNCDTTGSIIDNGGTQMHFVSPIAAPFDYHLANVASPAIDVAISSDVSVDFDGQARPNGQPDVGADELYPF